MSVSTDPAPFTFRWPSSFLERAIDNCADPDAKAAIEAIVALRSVDDLSRQLSGLILGIQLPWHLPRISQLDRAAAGLTRDAGKLSDDLHLYVLTLTAGRAYRASHTDQSARPAAAGQPQSAEPTPASETVAGEGIGGDHAER